MKKGCKIAITIVGVALVVVLLRGCVATSYLIPSSGMENSLYQSERILVNKWSYGLRLPFMKLWGYHRWADSPVQKEDILVFNNPANLSEPVIDRREVFISRCIGIPGDTLLIDSLFFSDSFRKECARPEVSLFLPQTTGTTVGFIAFHTFHRSQQTIGAGLNKEYTQFQPL